jgi:hypothetical protein
MNETVTAGRAVSPPERLTVLTVDPTAHLTDEQKQWRKVKVVPSANGDESQLVSVSSPVKEVLPAIAEMLTAGRVTDAEAVFARIRAAGLTLRAVIGDDGVLRVTVGA